MYANSPKTKPVITVSETESGGIEVNLHKGMGVEEISEVLAFIIKTSISLMDDAVENNEQAEMAILQMVEKSLIEDESSYID